ncbi:ABC transporter ATP-binding protein/permease [Actinomycetaceae bacterium TAE3-ERU4]|nr:ABC transporter ATP-binding protein/permease [Actinomycetaceae bacterium TAE3-ERU4]
MKSVTREIPKITAPPHSNYLKQAKLIGEQVPPVIKEPRFLPPLLDAPRGDDDLGQDSKTIIKSVLREHRVYLWLSLITSTGMRLSGMALPIIIGKIIDSGIERGMGTHLLPWTTALIVAILLMGIFWAIDQIGNVLIAFRTESYVIRSVAQSAISKGSALTRRTGTGNILTVVTDDSSAFGSFTLFLPALVASVITILVAGWVMITSSLPLGLLVIIGMPLAVFLVSALAKPMKNRSLSASNARAGLNTIANDAVLGLRVLRGVGGESMYAENYCKTSAEVRKKGIAVVPISASMAALRVAVPALFQTAIIALGAWLVFNGRMSAGTLLAFFGMTTYLQSATNTIVSAATTIVNAAVSSRRTANIMSVSPDFDDSNLEGINVSDTIFAEGEFIDSGSGLRVSPHELTALVGPNADILNKICEDLAFLRPDSQVTLGSYALAELPLRQVRKGVLYSHGEGGLFAGSLRETLLGPDAKPAPPLSAEEVMAQYAILQSPREDETSLPDFQDTSRDEALISGLHTARCEDVWQAMGTSLDGEILEKGRNLSGGQRQRLVLARALVQSSPALILVEPTSALDANTEASIGENLVRAREGKTTVVVTASPLLLRHAHRVVIFNENGQVIGEGKHASLMDYANSSDAAQLYRQIVTRHEG